MIGAIGAIFLFTGIVWQEFVVHKCKSDWRDDVTTPLLTIGMTLVTTSLVIWLWSHAP